MRPRQSRKQFVVLHNGKCETQRAVLTVNCCLLRVGGSAPGRVGSVAASVSGPAYSARAQLTKLISFASVCNVDVRVIGY